MLAGETTCRVPSDTAGYWAPAGVRERRAGQARRHAHLLPGSRPPGRSGRSPRDCRWWAATRRPNRPARTRTCRGAAGRPRACPPRTRTRRTTAGRGPSTGSSTGSSRRSTSRAAGTAPASARRTSRTRRVARARRGSGNVIPKLSERVHYGVMNPLGLDGTLAFQLSSGPAYSMHADFWNTWDQERLDQLVADCLIANVHCGSVDATSTIRWVRQFGTQRYDLANAAAPDGDGGSYTAGFTNFSLERTDVPPPLRRVPHPVRRGRRRGVDPAVRHERDRSGTRDLGLGDRRVRRGFDRRAVPQAEGGRRDATRSSPGSTHAAGWRG